MNEVEWATGRAIDVIVIECRLYASEQSEQFPFDGLDLLHPMRINALELIFSSK